MSNVMQYEYAELERRDAVLTLFSRDNEDGKQLTGSLFEALNLSAMESWEPILHYEEIREVYGFDKKIQVWILRRPLESETLTAEQKKAFSAGPMKYGRAKDLDGDED